jgi:hypothetical protein
VLTVLAGPVIVAIAWRPAVRARLATARFRRGASAAAVSLLVVVFAFLASRPLWEKTRGVRNLNLENMQARWHHPVDGTRTYHEQTVHWLALYLGWPTIVLAVAGYALLLVRLLRGRRYELAGVLAMGLPMSALYLWNGQVAPDQPWAMRRYVPEIMPLLLVAAVVALAVLADVRHRVPQGLGRLAAVTGCAFMIAFPLAVSWPMRGVRDEVPQLRQVHALCHRLGTHAAVVEVDDPTIFGYGQTLRSFCGVPTAGLISATPDELLAMKRAAAAHGRTLYVLSQDIAQPQYAPQTGIAPPAVPPPGFSTVTVSRWPTEINVAPSGPDVQTYTVFLATVDDAGLAHPVRR